MSARKLLNYASLSLLICTLSFSSAFAQSPKSLKYMTEEYPPFNYQDKGELQGVAVELLQAIWAEMGVPEQKIQLMPWARAYADAQNKKSTVLFSVTRSDEREKLFKWVGPIKSNKIGLIAKKDKGIEIKSVNDISKYTVGTVREDFSESVLVKAGYEVDEKNRTSKAVQNIKKLQAGRIDLFANSIEGAMQMIKTEGLNPNDYESVWELSDVALYYAFHIDTPDALVSEFQNALNQLEGARLELLKKYIK